jgi:uncharacterized protein YukE
MSGRVLSGPEAKAAITAMQRIINSGLAQQIQELNNQGQQLMNQNVWDGQLAAQFRSEWPQMHTQLNQMKDALEELRVNVEKINQNIMAAGGNA